MNQKIGGIFALFFLIAGCINVYHYETAFHSIPIICWVTAILYGISALYNSTTCKVIQVTITSLLVAVAMVTNNPTSLISLIVFGINIRMIQNYFPKLARYAIYMGIPYLIYGAILGWSLAQLSLSALLYLTYPTILYILNHDES